MQRKLIHPVRPPHSRPILPKTRRVVPRHPADIPNRRRHCAVLPRPNTKHHRQLQQLGAVLPILWQPQGRDAETPQLSRAGAGRFRLFSCVGRRRYERPGPSPCPPQRLRRSFPLIQFFFFFLSSLGVITSVLTNPIWVIKTRMLSTGAGAPGAYTSFTNGAKQIYRSEGIPGFYRGLLPALFGVSHGALQFMVYERLKVRRTQMAPDGESGPAQRRELGNLDFFLISSFSKIFAGCVTYPYQVLRSRLQTYDAHLAYRGIRDVVVQIWTREGIAGFYKGLGPNLFRVLPSTWVTFLVYENTRIHLPPLVSKV